MFVYQVFPFLVETSSAFSSILGLGKSKDFPFKRVSFVCLVKHFPSACKEVVEAVKKMVFRGKRRNSVLCYCIFSGTWMGLDA